MDDKQLKKITKKELLEILLSQAKRIEELEKELQITKDKLKSKKIMIEESGSLAEASLKLNKIFEIAQETADQYLLNIKENCKKEELETKKKCRKMTNDAEEHLKKVELKVKELTKKKERKTTSKNDLRKKINTQKRKKSKR